MSEDLRIVFMGTPEFAVTILDGIIKAGRNVVGVVTAPDKPAGRGQKLNQSDVKKYALEHKLNILQPTNLKAPDFVEKLQNLNADLFVVVAFRMLPEIVWSMPSKGTINLHASLLPNYRGAAPINWAIINGEKETGVTTFFIEKEIDTGKVIQREKLSIGENETVGALYDRLMKLGSKTVLSTLELIENENTPGIPQSELEIQNLRPAPKIYKDDCEINFNQPCERVHNFCRGLDPYPGAWSTLTDLKTGKELFVKLFSSKKTKKPVIDNSIIKEQDKILIPTRDFYCSFSEIQIQGKRKMDTKTFFLGNDINNFKITKSV